MPFVPPYLDDNSDYQQPDSIGSAPDAYYDPSRAPAQGIDLQVFKPGMDSQGDYHPGMSMQTLLRGNDADSMDFTNKPPPDSVKPVSQTLAEKIQQNGAYQDIPSYMADARLETYKLARAQGIDISTPDGKAWVDQTISSAEKAFPHYVVPNVDPKSYMKLDDGTVLNLKTGKPIYQNPYTNPPLQIPEIPTTGNNSTSLTPDDIQKQKDNEYQQALTRKYIRSRDPSGSAMNSALAKNDDKIIQRYEGDKAKKDALDKKDSEGLDKQFNDLLKTTPATVSGRSPLGTIMQSDLKVDRSLKLLSQKTMTPQEMDMVTGDLAGIIQNGAPHRDALEKQAYNTLKSKYASIAQYLTGKPTDIDNPEIRQRLTALAKDMKDVNQMVLNKHFKSLEDSHSPAIKRNQDSWDRFKEDWGVDTSKVGAIQDQTPTITSKAERDALPNGSEYIYQGQKHVKS